MIPAKGRYRLKHPQMPWKLEFLSPKEYAKLDRPFIDQDNVQDEDCRDIVSIKKMSIDAQSRQQRMEYNLFIYQLVNQNKSSQCKELLGVDIRPYPEVATEVESIFSLSIEVEEDGSATDSPQGRAYKEYAENNPQFVHQWHINCG